MDLENIILNEISQLEKVNYLMVSLLSGMQQTNWTNRENRDRLTESTPTALGVGVGVEGSSKNRKKRKSSWTESRHTFICQWQTLIPRDGTDQLYTLKKRRKRTHSPLPSHTFQGCSLEFSFTFWPEPVPLLSPSPTLLLWLRSRSPDKNQKGVCWSCTL